jgi:D-alanine-D-alanine ligase
VHQAVSEEATVDEQDVFAQRDAILAALARLGHAAEALPCTLDLAALRAELGRRDPELIFNLVESLGGSDQFITLAPQAYEAWGYRYTGVSAEGLWRTTNKLHGKRFYAEHSIPTLPWWDASAPDTIQNALVRELDWPSRWIRKPVWEHASFGMTDQAVIACENFSQLVHATRDWSKQLARPCFAEPYVAGREFNLSILAGETGPEVMPPAEIEFLNYAQDKPKIVGYAAKWTEDAAEYEGTPRTFDFPASDAPLLARLREIALRCWHRLGLRGYARVDFRVDEQSRPWVLEVNANPCIAPWSGFTAAIERAGYTYDQAIARILADATSRYPA